MIKKCYDRYMNVSDIQRHSGVVLIWRIVLTLIGFLSTIYFARVLGASVLGSYFLFLAYLGIFELIMDGGFGQALVKRVSEGLDRDAFFSAFLVQRSMFLIGSMLLLMMFKNNFVDLGDSGLFNWLLMALLVLFFSGIVKYGVYGIGKTGAFVSIKSISTVIVILIQVVAVYLGLNAVGLAGGYAAGMLIGGVLGLHFFNLRFKRFKWWHFKSLLSFSFWILLTSGGGIVFAHADTVLIGYFLDNADVGVYKIAFQFTGIAIITSTALQTALYPKVSRWGKVDEIDLVEKSLTRAFTYSLLLAVPVFIGGILFSDKLLYFFYGADFARGEVALIILLAMQIVNIFRYFLLMYLNALNYPKEAFKVTIIASILNIVLDVVLIPIFGINGAAIATLATMVINALLAHRALSKLMTIRIGSNSLINIVKASIAMALFIGIYRVFVTLSNVWLMLIPILVGTILYSILLLKLDKSILDELQQITIQLGLTWPRWL